MTCKDLCALLVDFVAGDLPEEHRQLLEQHMGKCPPCVAYFESYQIIIKLTRKLPCAAPQQQLIARLRAAMEEIEREKEV